MPIFPRDWESDPTIPSSWRIIRAFLQYDQLTQTELRNLTGLSHPVVVGQVKQLSRAGLIKRCTPIHGQPGRPSVPYCFNWDFRHMLSVEVHQSGIYVVPTNLACEPLAAPRSYALKRWTKTHIERALTRAIDKNLSFSAQGWAGISICIPARVSDDGSTLLRVLDIPTWQDDPFASRLIDKYQLPVLLVDAGMAPAKAVFGRKGVINKPIMVVTMRYAGAITFGLLDGATGTIGMSSCIGQVKFLACPHRECTECVAENRNLLDLLAAARELPGIRPAAIARLTDSLSLLITSIVPGRVVLQADADWTEEETGFIRKALRANCPEWAIKDIEFEVLPDRPDENLIGAAYSLSHQLLNPRTGKFAEWVEIGLD